MKPLLEGSRLALILLIDTHGETPGNVGEQALRFRRKRGQLAAHFA